MRLAFVGIYLATGKIVYTRYSQSVRTIKVLAGDASKYKPSRRNIGM